MNIELIPVLNIEWSSELIERPTQWPYWENSEIWELFYEKCQSEKGYLEPFVSYLKGSTLYEISKISLDNLKRYTKEWSHKLLTGEYNYEEGLSFPGCFVLRINGKNLFFPQCCGELSDIKFWEGISEGEITYNESHPLPKIEFKDGNLLLDFKVDEFDEPFLPEPLENNVKVKLTDLRIAVKKAKEELALLEEKLKVINKNIGVKEIGQTLIWFNPNNE